MIKDGERWFSFCLIIIVLGLVLYTCGCGLMPDKVIRHPEAPTLITEGKGYVRISVYERESNSLIDAGWVKLDELQGWTIMKYDWEAFIVKKAGGGN